jgi:hypothetical protein
MVEVCFVIGVSSETRSWFVIGVCSVTSCSSAGGVPGVFALSIPVVVCGLLLLAFVSVEGFLGAKRLSIAMLVFWFVVDDNFLVVKAFDGFILY